jgi:transposase
MESVSRDHDLAWRLADDLAGGLPAAERTAVFLELGCGHYWDAITRMLSAAVQEDLVVPPAMVSALCRWLNGYVHNIDEPATRALLARLRLRHFSQSTQTE